MLTPAGTECRHYFEDFHRGRNTQVCRLLEHTEQEGKWKPEFCATCQVPRIDQANACPNMILTIIPHTGILGIGKRMEINAHCTKTQQSVDIPQIGCGHCHEDTAHTFLEAPADPDPDA